MLKPAELAILVNTLTVAISKAGFTSDELSVIAAVLVQMGDTLATTAAQAEKNEKQHDCL